MTNGAGRLDRASYIGGSDARTILGKDENALLRLWQEKRGELEPEDLSGNLLVQFGCATEELNRRWFERETGHSIGAVQRFVRHPKLDWMGATLDGIVPDAGAVFEAKFMLPWNFAEDVAADKHMAQLQHNMLVTGSRRAYLSILTFIRTPGPPPFSAMNSTAASSSARRIARRLLNEGTRRPFSKSRTVERPRCAARANRSCDQSNRARAARD